MNNPTTIQNIRLFLISPSPMNPRKTFSQDDLQELADNIARQGLLQPITVRPMIKGQVVVESKGVHPDYYEIVCGERRYRACSLNKMETIPCIVREMTDDKALDAMITENLQRRDVDPVEEAEAFTILSGRGQSVADLAARFGRSESYIRDRMRLVSLIAPLQKALSGGLLPLRGAYLLSRLSQEDQNDFAEEEFDEDIYTSMQLTVDDVTEWLDRKFMNLLRAPFQNGKDLSEEWNPKGKYIRRCQFCECNTANQGCLFADMNTDEPQCTDEACYSRKCDIYYDQFIQQYASRITAAGQAIRPGDVAIRAGQVYGGDERKRLDDLKEKMALLGWRVFTEKELPYRLCGNDKDKKKALETGAAIEVIQLDEMARLHMRPELVYYSIASKSATSSPTDSHFMVARLCERAASIENNAKKQMTACAKKHFDKDEYILRDDILEEWELDILAAIIFDRIPWTEQDELIDGARNTNLTYKEIKNFREDQDNLAEANDDAPKWTWTRRAIASYIFGEHKQSYLVEAASQISGGVEAEIAGIRKKAQERIEAINDELREMGYDEKGNKI